MQGLHQLPQALPDGGHPHPRRARRHRRGALHRLRRVHPRLSLQGEEGVFRQAGAASRLQMEGRAARAVAVRAVRQSGRHRLCPSGAARLRLRRRVRGFARGGAGQRLHAALSPAGGYPQAGHQFGLPRGGAADFAAVSLSVRQRDAAAAPDGNRGDAGARAGAGTESRACGTRTSASASFLPAPPRSAMSKTASWGKRATSIWSSR